MRIKHLIQDFVVVEQIQLPLAKQGDYAVYEVEKQGVTTLSVQVSIAAQLGRPRSQVQAPALKDKRSIATQYLTIKGTGPSQIEGKGFKARFIGRSPRRLRPSDLRGNQFTITLRDLSPEESAWVERRLGEIRRYGLPNYYDRQRFGSYSRSHGFIGKTILQRDAEGAVRAYLARPFVGDPAPVRRFKQVAEQRWGEWAGLMDVAPRPSNYRSLLTYLKDHPVGYRKALNLIPRRLLSIYLVAYQSYLWNRFAAIYLDQVLSDTPRFELTILDWPHPMYHELPEPLHAQLSDLDLPLPQHRATYQEPTMEEIVQGVLDEQGFSLNDLKARILKKAYLPKHTRPLLLRPSKVSTVEIEADEQFPGRQAARLSFGLPSGSYATLVIRSLIPKKDPFEPKPKGEKGEPKEI